MASERLPEAVKPTRYDLNLSADLDGLTFRGMVDIHLDLLHRATCITLNAKDLEITRTLTFCPSSHKWANIPTNTITRNTEHQTITIPLRKPHKAWTKTILTLFFNGIIRPRDAGASGLQWTAYKTTSGEEKHFISTECEPIGARRIFPCLDEPCYKAKVFSTVTINRDIMVISNMGITHESITPESESSPMSKTVQFDVTPPIPTYLVCFVIGELENSHTAKRGIVPVCLYGVKDSAGTFQALDNGRSIYSVSLSRHSTSAGDCLDASTLWPNWIWWYCQRRRRQGIGGVLCLGSGPCRLMRRRHPQSRGRWRLRPYVVKLRINGLGIWRRWCGGMNCG